MSATTGKYININKLKGKAVDSTSIASAKRVAVYRSDEWIDTLRINNGSDVVWDAWNTVLSSVYDSIDMPAEGGNVVDYLSIESYGLDYSDTKHQLDYTMSVDNIPPNTQLSSVSHPIVISQTGTGAELTVTIVQEANSNTGISYSTPTVVDTATEMIEAVGGSTMLTIKYQQTKTTHYANGNDVVETLNGSTTATAISGNASISGATTDGPYVEMESAGTTSYSSARTVYTITSYTFSANGKSKTVTGASIPVKQEANTSTTSYGDYTITCNTTTTTVPAASSTFKVTAGCYRTKYLTWTSGSESSETEYGKVTMSGVNCSCSPTSYTSSSSSPTGTITVTTEQNTTSSTRKCTVYATDPDGKQKAVSVTQSAVAYVFTAMSSNPYTLAYDATSMSLSVKSTRNGSPYAISSSNVVISSVASISSITQSSSDSSVYNINLTTSKNTGNERSFTVTITQPGSGAKITYTVNQKAANSDAPSGLAVLARSGDWFIGTVFTGSYAGSGSAQKPLTSLVIAKNSAVTKEHTATYNLSYTTTTPGSTSPGAATTLNTTKSIASGSSVTINGTTYYGIAILSSQPALAVTVTSFSVS